MKTTSNNNDKHQDDGAFEKTYQSHKQGKLAFYMANRFCDESGCNHLKKDGCDNRLCMMNAFRDFHAARMFDNLVNITQIPEDMLHDKQNPDYPSEYFLACLSEIKTDNPQTCIQEELFWKWVETLEEVWWCSETGGITFDEKEKTLTFHTWGWSGNEDIMNALRHTLFGNLCFETVSKGGHYVFDLSKLVFMIKDGDKE